MIYYDRNCSYYSILVINILAINSRNEFLKHLCIIILKAKLITGTTVTITRAISRAALVNVLSSPAVDRISIFSNLFSIIKRHSTIGSLLLIVTATITTLQKS